MIAEVPLSRHRLRDFVPREEDDSGSTWLSGFAIPEAVSVHQFGDRLARFEFRYPNVVKGTGLVKIDDSDSPAVFVEFSPSSSVYRVLTIQFAPAVSIADLPDVMERMNRRADQEVLVGKRLSLRLIASILLPIAEGSINADTHSLPVSD